MSNSIDWKRYSKDEISAVLRGRESFDRLPGVEINSPTDIQASEDIAIGFSSIHIWSGINYPSILVLDQNAASEVISWIHAYSEGDFPLSQFCRVVTVQDWVASEDVLVIDRDIAVGPDLWSCIVLGEIIAQSHHVLDIRSLPLSRTFATFSYSVARAQLIYRHPKIAEICKDRLAYLSGSNAFINRSIGIKDLVPIWTVLSSDISRDSSLSNKILALLEEISERIECDEDLKRFLLANMEPGRSLFSNSVEERVVAFNRISTFVFESASHERFRAYYSFVIALTVFLIGRGTSHFSILFDFRERAQFSFVFFGLIAAIAGPSYWDDVWARVCKNIERPLKQAFQKNEFSNIDISWLDFVWIENAYSTGFKYSSFPRANYSSLSVEVFPGVSCQLALKNVGAQAIERSSGVQGAEGNSVSEIQKALNDILSIARKSIDMLAQGGVLTKEQQQNLDLDRDSSRASKKSNDHGKNLSKQSSKSRKNSRKRE